MTAIDPRDTISLVRELEEALDDNERLRAENQQLFKEAAEVRGLRRALATMEQDLDRARVGQDEAWAAARRYGEQANDLAAELRAAYDRLAGYERVAKKLIQLIEE